MDRVYLTNLDKISAFENNLVSVTLQNGEIVSPLEPRRLFPINNLNNYITLLDSDEVERFVIKSIDDLDDESKKVVCDSLDAYYLVPIISKIKNKFVQSGIDNFVVETNRGEKTFSINSPSRDIKVDANGTVRFRDSDDNRYIIENYHLLDKKSINYLFCFL